MLLKSIRYWCWSSLCYPLTGESRRLGAIDYSEFSSTFIWAPISLTRFISSSSAFRSVDYLSSSFLVSLIGRLVDFPDCVTWMLTDIRASEPAISLRRYSGWSRSSICVPHYTLVLTNLVSWWGPGFGVLTVLLSFLWELRVLLNSFLGKFLTPCTLNAVDFCWMVGLFAHEFITVLYCRLLPWIPWLFFEIMELATPRYYLLSIKLWPVVGPLWIRMGPWGGLPDLPLPVVFVTFCFWFLSFSAAL